MLIEKYHQTRQDPIELASHSGKFQFYSGTVLINQIQPNYSIFDLCRQANDEIKWQSTKVFEYQDHRQATFDIGQFVKINKLYHSLKQCSNIKPWLVFWRPDGFGTITGDSRRRAAELLPEITEVKTVISSTNHVLEYSPVRCFCDFASYCDAPLGTPFWFRIADIGSDHGLDWYEVGMDHSTGTSGQDFWNFCRRAMRGYMQQQPQDFRFTREWFTEVFDWNYYANLGSAET